MQPVVVVVVDFLHLLEAAMAASVAVATAVKHPAVEVTATEVMRFQAQAVAAVVVPEVLGQDLVLEVEELRV
jgi:hypothetical protein